MRDFLPDGYERVPGVTAARVDQPPRPGHIGAATGSARKLLDDPYRCTAACGRARQSRVTNEDLAGDDLGPGRGRRPVGRLLLHLTALLLGPGRGSRSSST